jgi:hypothetical protein
MNTNESDSRPSPDQEFSLDEARLMGAFPEYALSEQAMIDALHDSCMSPSEALSLS